MDALEELKERLDAVVRQLQEALTEATKTRSEVDLFVQSSKNDVASSQKAEDEPAET